MASTVWKGHLTFGLVSIPVRLFKATQPEKISFRQLGRARVSEAEPEPEPEFEAEPGFEAEFERQAEPMPAPPRRTAAAPAAAPATTPLAPLAPVHHELVANGAKVGPQEIVKGYEYEKDRYVVVEAEELKKLVPKTGTEMQIQEFVKLAEIDPVYFDASYYVVPDEAGEKAYSLLFATMKDSGYVALAEVAMHRRERLVGIRPGARGLIAHTLFRGSEVRRDLEFQSDTRGVNEREVHLAKQLVQSLLEPFDPAKFKDAYRE
ncbi:MAG: hypothetical protein JO022_21585, partial [Acidobacteriaceae bacterium]|nr:hypothetical protein [Acidobacteriaceae bacterium]